MGKSSFVREEWATVYYLITFLLARTWTTDAKPGCSHPKIYKLAWSEYFSVVNIDKLYDEKFTLQVAVVTEFPEEFASKPWQP